MCCFAASFIAVADPEFYNGGADGRGAKGAEGGEVCGGGGGCAPSPENKLNFYLKQVGFGAF